MDFYFEQKLRFLQKMRLQEKKSIMKFPFFLER